MAGSKSKYKSTTFDRNLDSFEFGMDFSDKSITEEIYRNGLAHFWVFGVVEEALADGFDLLDADGNILPVMDDLNSFFETTRYMQEFLQAVCYTRAYGKAGVLHFADGSIKGFKPSDMELEYDLKNREFKSARLREKSIYTPEDFEHSSEASADGNDLGFDLKYFMYLLFHEKDKTLEGKSVLEPIWDYIQGLFICAYLSPLTVAQTTGVKIMRSVNAAGMTSAQKTAALLPLREMSHKLAIIMPPTDELEIKYPPNNTFIEQTKDMLFAFLAAATGYPKEAWQGNQVGTLSGASQTENKVLEIHKTIQQQVTPYIKRSLRIIAELPTVSITLPDTFTVEWRFKHSMSSEQEAEQLTKQAAAVSGLGQVLTGNEIREILGKTSLDYFDDTVPLSASQNNDIGINVTGLDPFQQEQDFGQKQEQDTNNLEENENEIGNEKQNGSTNEFRKSTGPIQA